MAQPYIPKHSHRPPSITHIYNTLYKTAPNYSFVPAETVCPQARGFQKTSTHHHRHQSSARRNQACADSAAWWHFLAICDTFGGTTPRPAKRGSAQHDSGPTLANPIDSTIRSPPARGEAASPSSRHLRRFWLRQPQCLDSAASRPHLGKTYHHQNHHQPHLHRQPNATSYSPIHESPSSRYTSPADELRSHRHQPHPQKSRKANGALINIRSSHPSSDQGGTPRSPDPRRPTEKVGCLHSRSVTSRPSLTQRACTDTCAGSYFFLTPRVPSRHAPVRPRLRRYSRTCPRTRTKTASMPPSSHAQRQPEPTYGGRLSGRRSNTEAAVKPRLLCCYRGRPLRPRRNWTDPRKHSRKKVALNDSSHPSPTSRQPPQPPLLRAFTAPSTQTHQPPLRHPPHRCSNGEAESQHNHTPTPPTQERTPHQTRHLAQLDAPHTMPPMAYTHQQTTRHKAATQLTQQPRPLTGRDLLTRLTAHDDSRRLPNRSSPVPGAATALHKPSVHSPRSLTDAQCFALEH